jgi:hypothetical protein
LEKRKKSTGPKSIVANLLPHTVHQPGSRVNSGKWRNRADEGMLRNPGVGEMAIEITATQPP